MAIQVKLTTDFAAKLQSVADDMDKVAEKALVEGASIVEKQMRSNLQKVIGSGTKSQSQSTGQLLNALGKSPVKANIKTGGWDIKIGFLEPRKDGTPNALVANILEYGKKGQAPKPFMKPALNATRRKVRTTMSRVIDEEIEKIMGGK
jgi:HK97 gp10 family phage protein